jgi:hypothetical protein
MKCEDDYLLKDFEQYQIFMRHYSLLFMGYLKFYIVLLTAVFIVSYYILYEILPYCNSSYLFVFLVLSASFVLGIALLFIMIRVRIHYIFNVYQTIFIRAYYIKRSQIGDFSIDGEKLIQWDIKKFAPDRPGSVHWLIMHTVMLINSFFVGISIIFLCKYFSAFDVNSLTVILISLAIIGSLVCQFMISKKMINNYLKGYAKESLPR